MLFLAGWAKKMSWKETAEAFRTPWDDVFDAVEHVVTWNTERSARSALSASMRFSIPKGTNTGGTGQCEEFIYSLLALFRGSAACRASLQEVCGAGSMPIL